LRGARRDGVTSFNIAQLASHGGNAAAFVFFLFNFSTLTVRISGRGC
jgi:hypothetical protein